MKKIDTSGIVAGAGYPPSKKGFDFLQQSYQEVLGYLAQTFIGNTPSTTVGYVLYGCVRTLLGGTNYSFTAGAIYFNGEVYAVAAVPTISITTAAILTITVTNDPVADPTTFSNGSVHNVHNIRTLVISNGTSGSGTVDYNSLVFIQKGDAISVFSLDGTNTAATGGSPSIVGFVTYIIRNKILTAAINVQLTGGTGPFTNIRITPPVALQPIVSFLGLGLSDQVSSGYNVTISTGSLPYIDIAPLAGGGITAGSPRIVQGTISYPIA